MTYLNKMCLNILYTCVIIQDSDFFFVSTVREGAANCNDHLKLFI